jgi:hypothetical protein
MACKTYYAYLISIYDLDDYSYLSIYLVYLRNGMCDCAFVSMLYYRNLVYIHYLPHYLVT